MPAANRQAHVPHVHRVRPLTVETPRAALGDAVTPIRDVYVRQNLDLPAPEVIADSAAWQLAVEGVAHPAVLTLADLQQRATVTRRVVLECAGNGRELAGARFGDETPWGGGATACVAFTGTPVGDLVAALGGPVGGARYLTALGADAEGRAPDPWPQRVERSVPLAVGLDEALLAWALNGAPLPLLHGGPLRLVVPGHYAVNSVKFLRRLALTAEQSDADIQRVRYRLGPPDVPPSPAQPSLWRLRVKSMLCAPEEGAAVTAGPVEVAGVAWSGAGPVVRVELSADAGASWSAATLDEVAEPAAWQVFRGRVDLPPGRTLVVSRASDRAGAVQPETSAPTHSGYAHHGWRALGLTLHAR